MPLNTFYLLETKRRKQIQLERQRQSDHKERIPVLPVFVLGPAYTINTYPCWLLRRRKWCKKWMLIQQNTSCIFVHTAKLQRNNSPRTMCKICLTHSLFYCKCQRCINLDYFSLLISQESTFKKKMRQLWKNCHLFPLVREHPPFTGTVNVCFPSVL